MVSGLRRCVCRGQARNCDDVAAHAVNIAQHVVVPEAEKGPAQSCQLLIPQAVGLNLCIVTVLTAIHFDDDLL